MYDCHIPGKRRPRRRKKILESLKFVQIINNSSVLIDLNTRAPHDQHAIYRHTGHVALLNPHVREVHISKHTVAKCHLLERHGSLTHVLFVRWWANVPEHRATQLCRREIHIAEVDVVKTSTRQVDVRERRACHVEVFKLRAGNIFAFGRDFSGHALSIPPIKSPGRILAPAQ